MEQLVFIVFQRSVKVLPHSIEIFTNFTFNFYTCKNLCAKVICLKWSLLNQQIYHKTGKVHFLKTIFHLFLIEGKARYVDHDMHEDMQEKCCSKKISKRNSDKKYMLFAPTGLSACGKNDTSELPSTLVCLR